MHEVGMVLVANERHRRGRQPVPAKPGIVEVDNRWVRPFISTLRGCRSAWDQAERASRLAIAN